MTTQDTSDKQRSSQSAESSSGQRFAIRPEQLPKVPPCQAHCPNAGDIRGWLGVIAQHKKLGLSLEAAYDRAWQKIVERNPLPATLGRICPHPCESHCNRDFKDGAVAINAMERFLGDWGLEKELPFPEPDSPPRSESVGVIGSGPAGLSFAYQMARRGYPITMYERAPEPGGMLQYAIPDYRLPKDVLAGEIRRILDLGVELKVDTDVGTDISLAEVQERHEILFLGIGAQHAQRLLVPGADGTSVWTGIEYLHQRKGGNHVELGKRVAVIGGGNTAIDSARMARRDGAEVIVLYRRTRAEMPAAASEIEDALTEGIKIEFLAAPTAIIRDGDAVQAIAFQRMELGEPDASGRRRPVPIPGAEHHLEVDSVIIAISQEPDWGRLKRPPAEGDWAETDGSGKVEEHVWAGGDDRRLGIASLAVFQGRQAAEAVHAELRGLPAESATSSTPISPEQVKMDYYQEQLPVTLPRRPTEEWLAKPDLEIARTITSDEAQREAARCLSCGLCFGCQQCYMYCNAGGMIRLDEVEQGTYFAFIPDICEGCGKCIDVCPCGFLSVAESAAI
jgi:NADPH-dependent glutamate synthase beta subunit-like oxidoreductase/ferredoxin